MGVREFLEVIYMFTVLIVVMVSEVSTYTKTYQITYFNYVRFTIYRLYLIKAVNNKQHRFIHRLAISNHQGLRPRSYLLKDY